MKKEDYINKSGYCPKCQSMNLDYQPIEFCDDAGYYPYECRDCGLRGEEWYSLSFIGHNVYTENGDVIEL